MDTPSPDSISAFADCRALILAGGSGTRLWPLSRTLLPKQLLPLNGGESLLQQTVRRTLGVLPPEHVWVVTNEEHVFEVRNQLRTLDPLLDRQVLSEPQGRNTLPAILLGLEPIVRDTPEAIVGVFPSDHMIGDQDGWEAAFGRAQGLARDGWFVTFGIEPNTPETGYGYIARDRALSDGCYAVERFVEKPDVATAREFVDSGRYYWNSGMFVFGVQPFLEAVQEYQPALWQWWTGRDERSLTAGYASLPDVSVDYGIMEKVGNQAVVQADFDWDDLGSWEALYRLGEQDSSGCVVQGDVSALDCRDSMLYSQGGKLAAIGLEDMIVVQTRDATLVCSMDAVQKVKNVVQDLKAEGSSLVEAHVTVYRPWGSYTVLEESPFYKIKRITVNPGATLSLQMHHHRSEHWVVVSGTAEVHVGGEDKLLTENQSVDIPKTAVHRLANPGKVPVEIIEIQNGPYLEEDDIVRLEDVYGR